MRYFRIRWPGASVSVLGSRKVPRWAGRCASAEKTARKKSEAERNEN